MICCVVCLCCSQPVFLSIGGVGVIILRRNDSVGAGGMDFLICAILGEMATLSSPLALHWNVGLIRLLNELLPNIAIYLIDL